MNRIEPTKQLAAASIVVPAAAVIIWPSQLWLLAVFVVWLTLASVYWIWTERKAYESRIESASADIQQIAIRTLNHHRHDWMNDLQVIYGYIRMNKTDRTVQYVEQIRERMMTESKIAKLGIPSLVLFIQSFRTLTHSLVIDWDIDGELNLADLNVDGEACAKTIIEVINAYRYTVQPGLGDAATLCIDLLEEDRKLLVTFSCDTAIGEIDNWRTQCNKALEGSPLQLAESELDSGYMRLQAQLGN
ncbi:sensor kinase SpoOB-type protein [Paenibacillus taihuensis]|uniref:Sensor kinase SpoOB-type protein n=1 Tax=Paenibacillus taihuensis TaxID=1156355 RepID=A0A3D9R275_9BACL|nr:Spo0B domain-containing protein [Paenibacillus taihuensis]REE69488.1 sensor kinase SpoOB-type protein [Paenibacillus taihuensis]